MQIFPSQDIKKLFLSGDNSPAEEEYSPLQLSQTSQSRKTTDQSMTKNKRQIRKRNVQEITDELLLWKYFLDHKFQHHD